jgi:hypothetical protein
MMIGYYVYTNKLFLGKDYPFFCSLLKGHHRPRGQDSRTLEGERPYRRLSDNLVISMAVAQRGIGKNLATIAKDYGLKSE